MPGTKQIFETDYKKPLIGKLSCVVEHPQYGQYLRIRRICTLDCDFKTNADKLTQYYVNRGYPIRQLRAHYKGV